MKITFIGLSCFMIENEAGFRICVDPFNDSPEWTLGPVFPKQFNGKPFGANIVLMSESDADHANAPGDWLYHAPSTKPNSNPFPYLNLHGTVVYEWNGDINIAYSYTVDGIKLLHLADNAHILTKAQIKEMGRPYILFVSPSKVKLDGKDDATVIKNISLLKPKVVIWSHHIAPRDLPNTENVSELRKYFAGYFKANASSNKNYKNESSFMELCYVFENAINLNKKYKGVIINKPTLDIDKDFLKVIKGKPKSVLFQKMLE